ncbi:MAG TPA: hypothetical protein VKY62_11910 [Devosia sp.]|nr:hypothetical protein [Devosia sp.]
MTSSAPYRRSPDWRLILLAGAGAAVILVLRTLFARAELPFFADTDDAMRMVRVVDFIQGQPWYDLTAHRLNTPFGAELHWSRLVDLPLAGLVMAFTPLLGADLAIIATGYVWPMALLGVLLWISALLANRLVGPEGVLPAVVLPVLNPAITAEFTPGRVDHHNLVIILTLATAWASIEALRRPRFAVLSGLLAATALAIATEALPTIAAAILVLGLLYVFDAGKAATMRNFGLAFAAGAVGHLALFRPPGRWLEPACDVLSPVYVGVALAVAAAFTLASLIPARAAWQRFALLALLGGLGMGLVALAWPQCLQGPYGALDPWLQDNWIANIVEAKPWLVSVFELPAYGFAVGLPALLGTLVVLYRVLRVREDRGAWAALLVFLLCVALTMLAQVRGARLSVMPAMPAAAWLIVVARQRYLASPRLANIAGLMGSWLAFSGVILALVVSQLTTLTPGRAQEVTAARASKEPCLLPAAFVALAAMPPARIMSPIDLGAHIQLYTEHAVVAAPYHRNQQGVRDAFRFFNDPIADARAVLAARDIGLVVLCPGMAELQGLPSRAEDSFAALYAQDRLPAWLVAVSPPDSALTIYAVQPQ